MSNVKGLTYTLAICNIRKHLIRLSSVGSCPERLRMVSIICWRAQVYRILNYDETERIFSGSYRHNPACRDESLGVSHLEGEVWSHFLCEEAVSARLIAQLGRPSHPWPERPWVTCWVETIGQGSATDVLAGQTDLPSHVEPAPPGEWIPGVATFASEKAVYIWKPCVYTPAGGLQPALLLADNAFEYQVISGDWG